MLKPSRRLGMACAIAILGFASPTMAQVPVIDSASLAQIVNQLNEAKQQYSELVSQYNELKSTYNALSQNVNPNQWAQQLDQSAMQDTVPNTSILPNPTSTVEPGTIR